MSISKIATTAAVCLALAGAVLSPRAKANDWKRSTEVTFSGPVETELAQAVTLPPIQEVLADTSAPPMLLAQMLPATSSSLALVAMLGFLALAVSWTLRLLQKRIR